MNSNRNANPTKGKGNTVGFIDAISSKSCDEERGAFVRAKSHRHVTPPLAVTVNRCGNSAEQSDYHISDERASPATLFNAWYPSRLLINAPGQTCSGASGIVPHHTPCTPADQCSEQL